MRRKKNNANKSVNLQVLPVVHLNAAGIDVGAKEHVVAAPCDRDPQPVRTFQAFTPELHALAAWLKRCGIQTVALESTGIYWQLAALCSSRIKASRETVAKSLHGNWDEALLFALKVALETYRLNQIKIQDCDCCIKHHLSQFESRAEVINSPQNLNQLHRVCGVDLTKIPGIKPNSRS